MLRSPFAAKDPYEPAYYLGSWHQDANPALFICPLSAYVMSHSVGQLLSIPFFFFFFYEGYKAFLLASRTEASSIFITRWLPPVLSLENLVKEVLDLLKLL